MKPVLMLLLAIGIAAAERPNKTLSQFLHSMDRQTRIHIVEDARLTTLQLAAKYGYAGEEHFIETEDGYILALDRILPNLYCHRPKKVVLLQHGLLGSSADWVVLGPKKALAYLLSDACYDVWMGNARGNTYSRKHVKLSADDEAFWDFSFHEMGVYDLPATINYILQVTGQNNLNYVGHSQGTTSFFVLTSLHPEYKENIEEVFALAPIAFLGNSKSIMINILAKLNGAIEFVTGLIGLNEFLPSDDFTSTISSALCSDEVPIIQNVCTNIGFALFGYDTSQMNTTLLPVILGHVPAGTSTKQFLHYAQLVSSGKFQMYDYGTKTNGKLYGQSNPPAYPIENIDIPVNLWWGEGDSMTDAEDIRLLLHMLQSHSSASFKVPWKKWNQLDFVFGNDAKEFVYDPMIRIMDYVGKHKNSLKASGGK